MNENELLSKNSILIILFIALITTIVGTILLILGYNITFCEYFYYNETAYAIFSIITDLGSPGIQILVITVIYIAYDKKFAKNLAFSLISSGYLNGILKNIFQDPRPWTKREADGYGFPSGHAQGAVSLYGYISLHAYNKEEHKFVAWLFLIITYLIAISRVIIGRHDLQDILGGLLIGIGFLLGFVYLEPLMSEKINSLRVSFKIILASVIPILIFIIASIIFPNNEDNFGRTCGALFGLGIGYTIENKFIQYDPNELRKNQKTINLIIGIVSAFSLYFFLDLVPLDSEIWEFIMFSTITLTLILIFPWIFKKIQRPYNNDIPR